MCKVSLFLAALAWVELSRLLPVEPSSFGLKEWPARPNVRVDTVSVTCRSNAMEVRVKADLFELGVPVNGAELRLGPDALSGPACRATTTSTDEFTITAALTDCGTQYWVTDDALIYTNLLIYSPLPSVDGLIRMEDVVIPIECHYHRRYDVATDPVLPTWIPRHTTQSATENLDFSLKLMTSDWGTERGSRVYFLGDTINIEASVYMLQKSLRVFVASCVAATTPDPNSVPRYNFIDNNGCLVDGRLTGSRSHFLPRVQPDKLQVQLNAFIFHGVQSPEIYITCTLKAYPLNYVSVSMSKACSFIDGRWRSAEGDDWTCDSCENQEQTDVSNQFRQDWTAATFHLQQNPTKSPYLPGKWTDFKPGLLADSATGKEPAKLRTGMMVNGGRQTLQDYTAAWRSAAVSQKKGSPKAFEQEASIGPLSVFSWKNKGGVFHLPSVRGKKPIPHDSLWKNEVHAETYPEKVTIPDENSLHKDLWKKQPFTDEDPRLDEESAVSDPTETTLSITVSEVPSNETSPTVTSGQRTTVLVHPDEKAKEIAVSTESSIHPSSSLKLNSTQLESRMNVAGFSTNSVQTLAQDLNESKQKGPV